MKKIIFKGIVGSKAFGTNTENSDTDIATIYMCDNSDLLGFEYKEHEDTSKDDKGYELNKFIKLLMNGNPNMVEILNLPEDCILEKSKEWDEIQKIKDIFITKQLYSTFAGYGKTQILKAKGLNKKINWEGVKIEKKTILDFCYFLPFDNSETVAKPIKEWLKENDYKQEYCGLVGIDHFRYSYLLYIDELQWVKEANHRFSNIESYQFNGICREGADDICLSNVPKYCIPKGIVYINKDAYSSHSKDYTDYLNWKDKRNQDRYNTNKKHGQKYDSKNIMHLVRLLKTAEDIAKTGKIKVRRDKEEIEYLLKIKRGEINLQSIVDWSEGFILDLKSLFDLSNLPLDVDKKFCHELVIKLRNEI